MLQASQALGLLNTHLGRAALGGAIAGGGAMAYNAFTQPEYMVDARGKVVIGPDGQPVIANDNDINPLLAAGAGAAFGAGSRVVQDKVDDVLAMRRAMAARQQGVPMPDEQFFSGNWQ